MACKWMRDGAPGRGVRGPLRDRIESEAALPLVQVELGMVCSRRLHVMHSRDVGVLVITF